LVCLRNQKTLTPALIFEPRPSGVGHPDLNGTQSRRAQRFAMPLNAGVDMRAGHELSLFGVAESEGSQCYMQRTRLCVLR
jgi:hypothetical protein